MTAAYEHNGQPVTAEAFYAIACDPRRSVAVEACAGAGKTWMLVSRMLRALLDDKGKVQPHEILAITFTKKAAGEMRERLYEWLEKFAHADDETLRHELVIRGVLSQKSPTAPAELREQLSNLYQRVLANGRPVQIRTFHSWFAALLRSAPMATLQQLGLPVNYELLEDDAQAKALVWRRFYAALAAAPELKADFEAVVLTHGRFQADKALQVALDKRTEFTLADERGVVDSSVEHFGVMFPECAGLGHPDEHFSNSAPCRALMTAAAISLGRASAPTFSAKGVELEKAVTAGDFQAAMSALLTEKGTARKFGEKIVGIETIREAQELALRLAGARHQHEAWDYQQRMVRLSRLLLAEFGALKRERGWIDMNDVERVARIMLGDTVLSGWVQERLDARIRHLMIDEFQDTNPLQWQALSAWLRSYSGAGNAPSVFIVGDPKQSIYRFRRAEPQVFISAQKFIREGLGGDLLACDHTRRNSVAVINTVNAVMGDARANDGYAGFRDHTSASEESGMAIRLPPIPREAKDTGAGHIAEGSWRDSLTTPRELPEETLRTREARQASAWIAERTGQGLPPSEVMVLSRKRAGLLPLQDELRALRIPAQIGEKTELIDCCEVLDIVALLDVLVSTQHDLSLARALRSPLFGLSDGALVQIVLARGEAKAAWFDVLQKQELAIPELDGIAARLLKYKSWLDSLPPHDALQAIYHDGDVLARFAAAAPASARSTVLANLRALLNVALQLDGGRYATPYAFVRALKAGGLQAPAAVNPDAVRLLTIHGAKGLEAEAVLLLDTDTLERNADSMGVLIDWPGEAPAPQKFVFLVSESRPPACAVAMLEKEQQERAREELNALYVALTRAKNSLVVSSITPHRETTRSWWQRLHPFASEAAAPGPVNPAQDGDAADASAFTLAELPELPADKTLTPTPPLEQDDTDSSRFGQAMHRLLELDVRGSGPAARRAVDAIARQFRLLPAKMDEAIAMAARIRSGEAAWVWDPAVVCWQANEIELMVGGQSRRIDRLVQRRDAGHEGHWWVIDYKSAHQPEKDPELLAQMAAYRAALQTIYPGQVVKAAFLTGAGALIQVT
ncbi:MAG: UvrD-helicase domain-containing protein [Polaromonas sp.]|uniref:UvrD-helicase domain-containing protein n=1 Tax=Polaromonas sp. TaxID=1869339 RepID=UPI0025FF36BE|nr:UvrD-helicase domain-containing protein [Polaromonas sp.]MBI2725313.1 UvrD-helicase domain-containing protein [Polaromonas sp.]